MAEEYQPLKVAQLLDKTTVVVAGPRVEALSVGEELQILAVGRDIPGVDAPLIVPKALLKVTSVAGAYAIARTTTYEAQEDPMNWANPLSRRTVTRHYSLTVNDADLVGNPGQAPVRVGDPVIRPQDLSLLVAYIKTRGWSDRS